MVPDGRPILPAGLGRQVVTDLYQATHLGAKESAELFIPRYYVPNLMCSGKPLSVKENPTRDCSWIAGNGPGDIGVELY